MATNVVLQLADGEGLFSVVVFSGLSHPMIMHPSVLGEPALTRQAFYYLEDLDAVAQVRLDQGREELSNGSIEYLVDNYLFEYSKRHPEARISFKVSLGKFWNNDPSEYYIGVDQGHTQSLALDVRNDPHVAFIEAIDPTDKIDLTDWNIGENYITDRFEAYLKDTSLVLDKKVRTLVSPSDDRDGYLGKLRVIKPGYGLIDYWQAIGLSNTQLRSIPATADAYPLARSTCSQTLDALPIERIEANQLHAPLLLAHYFSGLKERNPLKAFVGFYNVLEYYFEEAPLLLGRSATNELNQLHCVIDLLVSDADVTAHIASLPRQALALVQSDLPTSSGISIRAFDFTASSAVAELARWLYEVRCAVIHSKKTRRGRPTATFEPYSEISLSLQHIVPVLRWLAVACIEKDTELRATGS